MARAKSNGTKDSSANLGFEQKLWIAVDKLRSNMDAAEYRPVVLRLTLRDTLLPKLLSGELSVMGAEIDANQRSHTEVLALRVKM